MAFPQVDLLDIGRPVQEEAWSVGALVMGHFKGAT